MIDLGSLPDLLIASVSVLAAAGSGIVWLIRRADRRASEFDWKQTSEREKLEKAFYAQIEMLKHDNSELRRDLTRYVRHVGILEGLLKAHGLDVPRMAGKEI